MDKEEFLFEIAKNKSVKNINLVGKAFEYCLKYHMGQKRASGEDYYTHPVAIALILNGMNFDEESIIAALLHDTLEDTSLTKEIIVIEFSEEVANLIEGVTKLKKIKFRENHIKKVENFRKLFLALSKDIRVLIIKLIDRYHNISTIRFLEEEKQKRVALETLEIFAPLAERIGLQDIKNHLEDVCFEILYPEDRSKILEEIQKFKDSFKIANVVEKIIEEFQLLMDSRNIKCEISGREKRPFSIWKKMKNKDILIYQMSDIIGFRFITESVDDCYIILGAIHQKYIAISNRFTDYISSPKINNYKSIHTSILGPQNYLVELQIRTKQMHLDAEYGLSVHWRYKQRISEIEKNRLHAGWIKRVLKILEDTVDPNQIIKNAKFEMNEETITAIGEGGRLINLPNGSTILDFAFALDRESGINFKKAFVNGYEVEIDYVIKDGDNIKILKDKQPTINSRLINYAMTGSAKNQIIKFLAGSKS